MKTIQNQVNDSDLGNMKRFLEHANGDLRYLSEKKQWIYFDGKCWSLKFAEKVSFEIAEKTIRSIYEEALKGDDLEQRKKLVKHALKSESLPRLTAMIKMAEPSLLINYDAFDQDEMLLNVANGTIDLETGKLLDHNKEHFMSKMIDIDYDPAANCPNWLNFLDLIMDGNSEMVTYLRRVAGYCLTGKTGERCLFILYGDGRNGKSTFTENIAYLLGDYAIHTPSETLLQKRFGEGISSDLARLKGARFVFASESARNRKLNEARIKALTGDKDTVTARFLYNNEFSYIPNFKIFLHTNHKPVITGTEQAIWDRIRLVPFQVRISDEQARSRDEVDKIFKAERPGILAWAVQGCLDWQKEGLGKPSVIADANRIYRDESDSMKVFIEEECIIGHDFKVGKTELYCYYDKFCRINGDQDLLTTKAFNAELKKRGFEDFRETTGDRKCFWKGIGIGGLPKFHTDLRAVK